MAYRKKTYRRKAPMRRKTFKRKSYAKKRQPLKKMIRREISRGRENKSCQFARNDQPLYSPSNIPQADNSIIDVSPSASTLDILQGVQQGDRIGNRITTKRLTFKGTIVPMPESATNATPRPVHIKMWFFYKRDAPTSFPTPVASSDFFQFNGTDNGFANDLVDLWKPINTDEYRVVTTRTFKVGTASYYTPSDPTQVSNQQFHNNDFKLNASFSIDLTKYIPKTIRYNENNGDPQSRHLFCLALPFYADSTAILSSAITAKISWMLNYVYEDA